MKTGRNDPCPCGSGRKFKHCCRRLESEARRGSVAGGDEHRTLALPGEVRRAATAAHRWQADIRPLASYTEDDPSARLGTLMVTAGGFVVHSDVLRRPSPEAEQMAEVILSGVLAARQTLDRTPESVEVGDEQTAAALRALLAERDLPIQVEAGATEEVTNVMRQMSQHMGGHMSGQSRPECWQGWDLPAEWVAEIHRAAARFHRARLWERCDEGLDVMAKAPSGRVWSLVIGGEAAGTGYLYAFTEITDFVGLVQLGLREPDECEGPFYSLFFEAGKSRTRAARREVAAAGWEVAAAGAYPVLVAVGSPAGGIRRADADDLLVLLRAVSALAEAAPGSITALADGWTDRDTKTSLVRFGGEIEDPDDELEWQGPGDAAVDRLVPGGAIGPGAEPAAALRQITRGGDELPLDQRRLDRFAAYLEATGLKPATVSRHRDNVFLFLDFLRGSGVPLAAVHELDLRTFLFDWYPRKVMDSRTGAGSTPTSLKRFFRFLAEEEGIDCPWAAPILRHKDAFLARWESFPGGFFWDPAVQTWRAAVARDLDRRLLIPRSQLAEDDEWGLTMGPREAGLHEELQRRWLLWRDEAIAAGPERSVTLRPLLEQRQLRWETSPHPRHEGKTPLEVIRAERPRPDQRR